MKKLFLAHTFFILVLSVGFAQSKKAQKYYKRAIEIFEGANLSEWKVDVTSAEKNKVLQKLNKSIELAPNWWNPYKEKIQVLIIGSWKTNAKAVNDVYKDWIQNGNDLDKKQQFSYACALYCYKNPQQAKKSLKKLNLELSNTLRNDEEKIYYLLSGIIIENILIEDLEETVSNVLSESMIPFFEDFYNQFNENPRNILWAYAG